MIHYTQGDILKSDAEALVNTVNCVGVMGRGIALQFKTAYPGNFKAYAAACKRGDVQPGRMFTYDTHQLQPRWIINFPTKRHWRGKSRVEDIEAGLVALVETLQSHKIRSVAIPPLGSGLGGLRWSDVRPLIENALAALPDTKVIVHEPSSDAAGSLRAPKAPKMTPGRAVLVGLVQRYLGGLMDPSVSLLELHKLMYFQQTAGEPLRLNYVKALYGPYAENLRHVLLAVEGHLLEGYTGEGDGPTEQLALIAGAPEKATAFLSGHEATRQRFDRVAELVDGFETPYGLELLATAHWVSVNEAARTDDAVINAFYAWNPRKQQFTRSQIQRAIEQLKRGDWLPAD